MASREDLAIELQGLPPRARQWLHAMRSRATRFRFLGATTRETRLDLAQTYVPLTVVTSDGLVDDDVGDGPQRGRKADRALAGADHGTVTIEEAIERAEAPPERGLARVGLVVIGEPGSGKSTLLRQLCGRAVTAGSASLRFPPGLVPVWLRCDDDFVTDCVRDEGPDGLRGLVEGAAAALGYGGAGHAAVDHAPAHSFLFLLDALDEVRDREQRAALCRWLCDQLDHPRWDGSRFVITCREAAWREQQGLDQRFLQVNVQGLDDEGIRALVRAYVDAFRPARARPGEPTTDARADAVLERLIGSGRRHTDPLRRLTPNPSLLAQLCLVCADPRAELPRNRNELHDRCLHALVSIPPAQPPGAEGLPATATIRALAPLAWAMQVGGDATRWPADAMAAQLADCVHDNDDLSRIGPPAVVARLRDTCGVLDGSAHDHRFAHLSFQEYLAARYARAPAPVHPRVAPRPLVDALASQAHDSAWKEVILLAVEAGLFAPFVGALADLASLDDHRPLLTECVAAALPLDEPAVLALFDTLWGRDEAGRAAATVVLDVLGTRQPLALIARALEAVTPSHPIQGQWSRWGAAVVASFVGHVTPGRDFVDPVLGRTFLWVPGGAFWMGSSMDPDHPAYDEEAVRYELEARWVSVAQDPATCVVAPPGFWIARYPVTHGDYARYLDSQRNASATPKEPTYWRDPRFNADDQPVVGVSWNEARAYCDWLTATASPPRGLTFRLPTEAEWEYAARGSHASSDDHTKVAKYPWGREFPTTQHADFDQILATGKPTPVGTHGHGRSAFSRAEDMAGGIWEWCLDGWRDSYRLVDAGVVDPCQREPPHPRLGSRVVRGGSWSGGARTLRSAFRFLYPPEDRNCVLGFRVVYGGSRQHVEP